MKKIKFELVVTHEDERGLPERELRLQDELNVPLHIDDENLGFDTDAFGELIFGLYILAFCKGIGYGNAWKKRGEIRSCIANLDRKFDRISKSIDDITEHGHNDPTARIDGTADLVVYGLLYLSSYLKSEYADNYANWWKKDVRDFIEQYQEVFSK